MKLISRIFNFKILFNQCFVLILLIVFPIIFLVLPTNAAPTIKVDSFVGQVTYRDRDTKQDIQVKVGQPVKRGGRLFRKGANAQVSLTCEDNQKRYLTSAKSKSVLEICEAPPNSRLNPEQFLAGGYDSSIPYIISPRYTRIKTSRPTLKWNAVQGVDEYEVTICEIEEGSCVRRFDPVKYHTSKKRMEVLEYPFGIKLEKDKEYKLVITTNQDIASPQEENNLKEKYGDLRKYYAPEFIGGGVSGLNFKVLEERTRKNILEPKLQAISNWQEPSEIKEFGIVLAYENNYLYSEAIEN